MRRLINERFNPPAQPKKKNRRSKAILQESKDQLSLDSSQPVTLTASQNFKLQQALNQSPDPGETRDAGRVKEIADELSLGGSFGKHDAGDRLSEDSVLICVPRTDLNKTADSRQDVAGSKAIDQISKSRNKLKSTRKSANAGKQSAVADAQQPMLNLGSQKVMKHRVANQTPGLSIVAAIPKLEETEQKRFESLGSAQHLPEVNIHNFRISRKSKSNQAYMPSVIRRESETV